jgi:23S rRNA (uridine2552-2'-O)-methyltransferase
MVRSGVKDPYRVRAKKEGFPARSVYKLKEIQERFDLIRPGQRILDLGCHPGSWLLFCSQIAGPGGRVFGIDLKAPAIPHRENISFLQGDVLKLAEDEIRDWAGEVDLILSDLAPKTSGIKWLDHQRSLDLNRRVLEIAPFLLRNGGRLLVKLFEGQGSPDFLEAMKRRFHPVHIVKPKSSRRESREIYLVGEGFKKTGG